MCLLLVPTMDEEGEAVGDFCKWEIFLLETRLLLSSKSDRISKIKPETSIWKASPVLCNSIRLLGIFSPQIPPHFPCEICGPSREELGWKGFPGASLLNAESWKLAPMQSPDNMGEDIKE